jgi:hypothetical protein
MEYIIALGHQQSKAANQATLIGACLDDRSVIDDLNFSSSLEKLQVPESEHLVILQYGACSRYHVPVCGHEHGAALHLARNRPRNRQRSGRAWGDSIQRCTHQAPVPLIGMPNTNDWDS